MWSNSVLDGNLISFVCVCVCGGGGGGGGGACSYVCVYVCI